VQPHHGRVDVARGVVNGLDYWRRRGDPFIENWVFVDMVHLFRQFGVDLLARIRDPDH